MRHPEILRWFAMKRSALFGISLLGWILFSPIEGFPAVDSPDLIEMSQDSVDRRECAGSPEESRPEEMSYLKLESALAQYQDLQRRGGWPSVPDGPPMRKGDSGARIAILRDRLLISGDLEEVDEQHPDLLDDEMDLAVREFQERHGRTVDGIVGPNTLTDLNISVEQRVRQIELNLERRRQLPWDLGERFIMVNTASFQLEVVEKGQRLMKMRVVAGRRSRRTPEVSSELTYLVLNPCWNIPHGIAKRDILPKIQEDPHYLLRQDILVFENWENDSPKIDAQSVDWSKMTEKAFSFKLRQEPGPRNALGHIKFAFPNPFSVYLHGTPVQSLFRKTQRDFSSGCVRIEKPIELASLLLESEPEWTRKRIVNTVRRGKTQVVRLSKRIPVHISYWTAWADENGTIHFRDDIYGRDKSLESLLSRSFPRSHLAN